MATIERQLQLEGRLVKILIMALLLSWIGAVAGAGHMLKLRDQRDNLQVQRDSALQRADAALWVAEDQRLAVRACYSRRIGTLRKSVAHVSMND